MPQRICPYLGQAEDADTALEFPASSNTCHHASPIRPVRMAHQRQFCLTGAHKACPVYQRPALAPLPDGIAAVPARKLSNYWPVGALLGLLLVGALLFLGLPRALAMLNRPEAPDTPPPATLTVPAATDTLAVVIATAGPSDTPVPPSPTPSASPSATSDSGIPLWRDESTSTPNPTRAACPLPPGWTEYVVKPTDSLLRLSQLYSVSVAQLMEFNCLPSQVVRAGDKIFVPIIFTLTPYVPPTRTNTVRPIFPTLDLRPTSRPTSAPPTQAPPTKAPPTAVPPTPVPPTPVPPTPVPPTQEPTVPPPPPV